MVQKERGAIRFDETAVEDVYADAVNVETGFYGVTFTFGVSRVDHPPLAKVKVRVSPQLAKVLYLLLRKQLRSYERELTRIEIPQNLVKQLELEIAEVI